MFGRMGGSRGNTTFANFNGKNGLFTIDHKAQNEENSYRQHLTTTGRTVFKEEHEAMMEVHVRRVLIKQESDYNDKTKMVNKVWVSVRDQDGNDAVVKFSMGQHAVKVLGLLNSADLSQPLTLRGGMFEKGTKKRDLNTGEETVRESDETFLVGYQGGEKLVAKFSDDPNFKIPKVEKIEVKNPSTGALLDTISDPTNRDDFCVSFADEVKGKVEAAIKNQAAPAPSSAKPLPPVDASDGQDDSLSRDDVLGDGGASDAERFAPA